MATQNDGYLNRLLGAVTGTGATRSSIQTGTELIQAVTGTKAATGVSTTVAGAAVRIGSAALGKGTESVASAAAGVGRSLLSLGGSPVGMLTSLLAGVFSGGSSGSTAKPQRYQAPQRIQYDLGVSGSEAGYAPVDAGTTGVARSAGAASSGGQGGVVIQVQAMDSRSFLDHSNEIAEAVRKALLDSHPLRDVLSE